MGQRYVFEFKDLDVYRLALGFFAWASEVAETRHRGFVCDQWLRASLSILNNIGEGALEFSPAAKANFFRIARRSGGECAALLDVLLIKKVIDEETHDAQEAVLARICAMLTKLAQLHEASGRTSTSTSTSPSTKTPPRRHRRAGSAAAEPPA